MEAKANTVLRNIKLERDAKFTDTLKLIVTEGIRSASYAISWASNGSVLPIQILENTNINNLHLSARGQSFQLRLGEIKLNILNKEGDCKLSTKDEKLD